MSFDDQLEALEMEAFRELDAVPHDQLAYRPAYRASGSEAAYSEVNDAVGALLSFKGHRRADALDWARQFAGRFLSQIRAQICADTGAAGLASQAGITPKAAASAVAAWIVASFGVVNPVAFAMATLIILVLGRALRAAFCGMPDAELRLALTQA